MDELRVPKRRTPVEIVLPGGTVRHVAVFLGEFARDHTGAERVSDVLNGEDDFFPALDTDADAMTFLNRAGIAVARVPRAIEADTIDDTTIPVEFDVEIRMADGSELVGLVAFVPPGDRVRLIDYLNHAPPFFPLVQGEQVALVNKRRVARVALRER